MSFANCWGSAWGSSGGSGEIVYVPCSIKASIVAPQPVNVSLPQNIEQRVRLFDEHVKVSVEEID